MQSTMYAEQKRAASRRPDYLQQSVAQARQEGFLTKSMPSALRSQFEQSHGYRFDNVKVVESSLPDRLGMQALTQGSTIHFPHGGFKPSSRAGKEILDHELGHTVQQAKGLVPQNGGQVHENSALENSAESGSLGGMNGFRSGAMEGVPSMGTASAPIQGWPWKKKPGAPTAPATPTTPATPATPKPSFGERMKTGAVNTFDWFRDRQEDIGDLAKQAKTGLRNGWQAVRDSKFGKGMSNAGHAIGDKAKSAWGGIKTGATQLGTTIKDSKFGKGIAGAGRAIGDKAKSAWTGIKTGATQLGTTIKDSKFGKGIAGAGRAIGDKAKSAWTDMKTGAQSTAKQVKESKFGQFVGNTYRKGVDFKNNLGDKIMNSAAVKKVSGWKQQIGDKIDNFKDAYHDHDFERHALRKIRLGDTDYLDRYEAAQASLQDRDSVKRLSDVDHLSSYDEATRSYADAAPAPASTPASTPAPSPSPAPAPAPAPTDPTNADKVVGGIGDGIGAGYDAVTDIGGKTEDAVKLIGSFSESVKDAAQANNSLGGFTNAAGVMGDAKDLVSGLSDTRESATVGNAGDTASNMVGMGKTAMSLAKGGLDIAGNEGKAIPGLGLAMGLSDIGGGALDTGKATYRKHQLKALEGGSDSHADVGAVGNEVMDNYLDSSISEQSRRQAQGGFRMAKGVLSTGTNAAALSGVAAGVTAPIQILGGLGISMAENATLSHMDKKADKRLLRKAVFGGDQRYRQAKTDAKMDSYAMKRMMAKSTGTKDYRALADRVRIEGAQQVHQGLTREGSRARAIVGAQGDTNFDRVSLERVMKSGGVRNGELSAGVRDWSTDHGVAADKIEAARKVATARAARKKKTP